MTGSRILFWARITFWTLLFLSGVIILYRLDTRRDPQRMGRAVACSRRFPFDRKQAQILEYGLRDPRGLAWDPEKSRLFISESNRSLLIDWLDTAASGNSMPSIEETEPQTMCPDESCGVADERGLAIVDEKLFVAEHGRGRVSWRNLPEGRFDKDKDAYSDTGAAWLSSATQQQGTQALTEPSGIAGVGACKTTLFITDEPLRSVPVPEAAAAKAARPKTPAAKADSTKAAALTAASEKSVDASAKPAGDSEKAPAQPSGALYVCESDQCLPITKSLHHPSGVAAETAEGPVFVAEAGSNEVRWPVYQKVDGKWQEIRSLGTVPISGENLPSFLGIALDDGRKMLFAAGPGGLYVFDFDGNLLGRVLFDEPVTGVATDGNFVYLAVGHSVGSLELPRVVPPGQAGQEKDARVGQPAGQQPAKSVAKTPGAKRGSGGGRNSPQTPQTQQPTPPPQQARKQHCQPKQASGKHQNCKCRCTSNDQKSESRFQADPSRCFATSLESEVKRSGSLQRAADGD